MLLNILGSFLAFASVAEAEVFRLINDDQQAAQIRVDLIQRAQHTIDIEYYIVKHDDFGLEGLAMLREAVRERHVKVRILFDYFSGKIPANIEQYLIEQGFEIKKYHPFTIKHPSWITRRLHDKTFIVDDEYFVGGGRNIEAAYFGWAPRNFVDRDVYIHSRKIVKEEIREKHFDKLWSSSEVVEANTGIYTPAYRDMSMCERLQRGQLQDLCLHTRNASRQGAKAAEEQIDWALAEIKRVKFVQVPSAIDWDAGQPDIAVEKIWFMHDIPGKKTKLPGTREGLLDLLKTATRSIFIETPYLVPGTAFLDVFRSAKQKGVRIQILTNSARSADSEITVAGYMNHRKELLNLGVELYEYRGPHILHAKSIVIDGEADPATGRIQENAKIAIGSYNLDPRSEFLNAEIMVAAESPLLASDLMQSIGTHLRDAYALDKTGKPLGEVLPLSASQRRWLRFYRALTRIPFIEDQL